MCFTSNYFWGNTMKQKKLKKRVCNALHENCKRCISKNCCSIYKDYKELKENGFTATADLICFMSILDREATYDLERFKHDIKDFKGWALKMHLQSYAKTFGLLWKLYKDNDENRLTKEIIKYIYVYTCHILESHNLLNGIEAILGINLTTKYNDFIMDMIIEEVNKNGKIL